MLYIIIICCVLTLAYLVLMLTYSNGWRMQPVFKVPTSFVPQANITIIIPARNEAANIKACINSILAQNYPAHLFDIIVIDDHSEDDTVTIVKDMGADNVKCLELSEHMQADGHFVAYKKAAITLGVNNSSGNLIITTDADCVASPDWLRYIAAKYERVKPVMIVSPVDYIPGRGLLHIFQSLDFMSMQGITAAANKLQLGNMSNGANLAFNKAAFMAVNGYEGVDHLASGDDYLLMMKLQQKYPGRISYIKATQAIVTTTPQDSWAGFFQQRIRWASKSGKYNDDKLTAILSLVYVFNVSLLVLFIAGIFDPFFFTIAFLMLAWKTATELFFLYPVARFFKKTRQLWYFPFLQPLHIVYIIAAGMLGFAGVYKWKGRITK